MNSSVILTLLVICLAISSFCQAEKASRPNIVVVLADDIGSGDISYFTQKFVKKTPVFETPNIDALANKGIWFSDGHSATALCAPTRYALMSGKNNYRSYAPWGVWGMFRENAISKQEATIARVVQQAGYSTGFVGKWHLGSDFKLKHSDKIFRGSSKQNLPQVDVSKVLGGGPKDMGFDYSFMLPDGIQGSIYLAYENETWYPLKQQSKIQHINADNVYDKRMISDKGPGMGDSHWRTEEIGDIISQKAVDFIKRQKDTTPFMLYYASPMAHLPHVPPEYFDGIKVAGTTGSPHMDMVKELDLQVGRIVRALKEVNQLENTLFIFTSDNGGLGQNLTKSKGHLANGNFRGSKNDPYEGGHRVPFIVHWPAKVKTNKVIDEPVVVQDLLATFAAVAGNLLDKQQAPDSNNLLPLITGQSGFKPRDYLMLQAGSKNQVVFRQGDWKLIMQSNHKLTKFDPIALFNLKQNPFENEDDNFVEHNEYQSKISQMRTRYLKLRNSGVATAW